MRPFAAPSARSFSRASTAVADYARAMDRARHGACGLLALCLAAATAPSAAGAPRPTPAELDEVRSGLAGIEPARTPRPWPHRLAPALQAVALDPGHLRPVRVRALMALSRWPDRIASVADRLCRDPDASVWLQRSAARVWIGADPSRPRAWLHLLEHPRAPVQAGALEALRTLPPAHRPRVEPALSTLEAREPPRRVQAAFQRLRRAWSRPHPEPGPNELAR